MASHQLTVSEDLFLSILSFVGATHADLIFLWTTCREVSRNFKYTVERLFIARHLRKTYIRIDVGENRTMGLNKFSLGVVFCFAQVDPDDRERAIFRIQEDCPDDFKPMLRQRFDSLFNQAGSPAQQPRAIVQIRRHANDTSVPDMFPDREKLEIKVNWVGVYSEFFKEEKEYTRRLEVFMDKLDQSATEMHQKLELGELDLMSFLQSAVGTFPDGSRDLRRAIRAERIARNVKKESGIDWDDSDDPGYQRLKEISFAVRFDDQYSSSGSASGGETENDDDEDRGTE
ncbi:hypothetical protein Moror_9214 [Moniliophthora roreri MCA 2997]|uniref:Uncharacterized protein n=1 Tax=Moniliophthora roreri (strain MCA 2997) TaxID=1381753 RepID=V2WTQ4_MONRO|nr:hypothetical protein Moror_9214 [Moniliophthora roreri MCA 2997]